MINNTPEWYDYIDELVIRFQAGESECGMELLEIFQPFLLKYIAIIKEGKISFADRDTRKFIALFMNDSETIRLMAKRYQSTSVRNSAYRTAAYLVKACSGIDTEELKQEMSVAFFTLSNRWVNRKGKSNFCGYVYNCFRYEMRRAISSLIKDPIGNSTYLNLRYYDDDNVTEDEDVVNKINTDKTIMLTIEDEVDSNWVRGLTCSEEFLSLTELQRSILKEYYYEELSDRAIAEKTGLHVNTIFRNRNKAVTILKEQFGKVYD